MQAPAAFLDRDGVINIDHGYVFRREEFHFVPQVIDGARILHDIGFRLVVVTNQSGIGRGFYSEADFAALTEWMAQRFAEAGAPLAGVYFCPHHATEGVGRYRCACDCRKPEPGMLLLAAQQLQLDLGRSVLFGDRESDLLAAQRAGVPRRVLLSTNGAGMPAESAEPGLATAAAPDLWQAMQDPALVAALRGSSPLETSIE